MAMSIEERRKRNREYMRMLYRTRPGHKERVIANGKKWHLANLELSKSKMRARKLKRKYGITPEQYDALFEMQAGVCALCQKSEPNRRLAVDHDHKTGAVRGLLCTACNRTLGIIETRVKGSLMSIMLYLSRSNAFLYKRTF